MRNSQIQRLYLANMSEIRIPQQTLINLKLQSKADRLKMLNIWVALRQQYFQAKGIQQIWLFWLIAECVKLMIYRLSDSLIDDVYNLTIENVQTIAASDQILDQL